MVLFYKTGLGHLLVSTTAASSEMLFRTMLFRTLGA
jgi:hypothetical protein